MWKFLELPKRNDGKFIKKAFISKIGEKGFNLDPSTLTWVLINLNFIYSDIVSNIGSSILLIITIEGIKSMRSQIIRLIAWLVGLNSRAIHVSRPTSLIQPTLQLTSEPVEEAIGPNSLTLSQFLFLNAILSGIPLSRLSTLIHFLFFVKIFL